jgi:sugar/nucleoside kinase (ribokinase family)
MTASPQYVCVSHTFIDDIVLPSGKTRMGVLGGGGIHAAAGIRVWDERPGLIGAAGRDMPENARQRLQAEFDCQGITWLDVPQLRAWQLFELDNRRTEVLRVTPQGLFEHDPAPTLCPDAYAGTRAAAILNWGAGFLQWRKHFPDAILLWEPNQTYMTPANRDEFRQVLSAANVVSPNLAEARALYGIDPPEDLVCQMLEDGAPVVALRMGEMGSLTGQRGRAELLYVPAVPVKRIIDQTGAGNAYCGGFLVGWYRTGDLWEASSYGAVSASFALEVFGPIAVNDRVVAQRQKRYTWIKERIEPKTIGLRS